MQPLEYKNIGSEEHLTFDSIRRLVRHELSEQSEVEAVKHIEDCERCQGIFQSLTAPHEVRQQNIQQRKFNPFLAGILSVLVLIGLAASVLFFGAESKAPEKIAKFNPTSPIEVEKIPDEVENAAPVIEAIDTIAQVKV